MTQGTLFGTPPQSDARISDCGRYRWWLSRSWEGGNGSVCFVMLNPSTADASHDDPTIRRCIGFAKWWGFQSLTVRNLFAFRATDPRELLKADDPTGGEQGDDQIRAAKNAHMIVVAWGSKVPFGRDQQALRLLRGAELKCLGLTKSGFPRHPLYVKSATTLVPFVGGDA